MNQFYLLPCYSNKRGKGYLELKGSKYGTNKLKSYNKVHDHTMEYTTTECNIIE